MNVEENLWLQIEKLREQIIANPDGRTWDEANTCSVLIDPLLRELGWATDDLSQVRRQYSVGRGKVDYALFKDGEQKPAVLIEAKRISDPVGSGPLGGMPETGNPSKTLRLRDAAIQGIGYCLAAEVQYLAVTDGRHWYIYDACEKGFMDKKLKTSFDLMADSAVDECLRATVLWRQGVNPVDNGRKLGKKPPAREFAHGMCVDDEGYVLTKGGRRDKRYSSDPYPPGTKWVVDGFPLDEKGWVLTPKGNRATRFKYPCPTNTKRILDWGGRRHFLDDEGYVLTKSGKRDRRYSSEPYPPGAVVFVDGFPLDEEGWILTKSGKRDERYTWPYGEYDI